MPGLIALLHIHGVSRVLGTAAWGTETWVQVGALRTPDPPQRALGFPAAALFCPGVQTLGRGPCAAGT